MELLSSHHLTVFITLLTFSPLTQVVDGLRESLRCPMRVLKNGRVRMRSKGRVAKYVCMRNYQLLGDRYSTCVLGRWDSPVPICIKSGCLPIDVPHGQVLDPYRGALVTVHCDPGYTLIGSQSLYCNGANWNDTQPTCREMPTWVRAQKWCDFESEDLCGWTHDSSHDFDWRRHNFATPSGHVGTGPSFDHTLGPGLNGHYMYLEVSSPRLENDTARLFSPVFNAVADANACFIFWYHMFGITTGTVNVYVHEQDTTLLFSESGDHGDQWLQAVVPLPQITSSFQIVIEGVRGSGYEGDIAIDDVKLAEGPECSVTTSSTLSDDLETATAEAHSSCEGRCSMTAVLPTMCECTADCIGNNTCCPDYIQKCSLNVSNATIEPEFTTVASSTSPPITMIGTENSTTLSNTTTTSISAIPSNNSATPIPSYHPTLSDSQTNVSESVNTQRFFNDSFTTVPVTFSTTPRLSNSTTVTKSVPTTPRLSNSTTVTKSVSNIPQLSNSTTVTTSVPTTPLLSNSTTVVPITNSTVTKQSTTFTSANQTVTTNGTFYITPSMAVAVPTTPSLKTTSQSKITFPPTTPSTKKTTIFFRWKLLRSTTLKPKIKFVTPPPPVLFRTPAKTLKPFTKSVRYDSVPYVPITITTQSTRKLFNRTEKVSKSKNDVLHPVWFKNPLTTPALPPLGPNPGTLTNKTTMSTIHPTTAWLPTTQYSRRSNSTKLTEYKWKSKYKPRVEAPVHAQYAVPSSPPGHVVHIIMLVSGVLLVLTTAMATFCVLRRRKINRRRMEDDELDIQFLASDEILDFTLARPSMEDIQMKETRR